MRGSHLSSVRPGNPPTCAKLDPVCNDRCHLDTVALIADSIKRLGNGMFIFVSAGPWGTHRGENPSPNGCSFHNMTQWAPYVRVGQDTADSWGGMNTGIDGTTTRLIAPLIQPHHYGDLASLMVGKVHSSGGTPGPDYFIPSKQSHLSSDEVYTFASMGELRCCSLPACVRACVRACLPTCPPDSISDCSRDIPFELVA